MPRDDHAKHQAQRCTAALHAGLPPACYNARAMDLETILYSQGFGSRRQCRALVEAGRVSIDGIVRDDADADFATDDLHFDVDGTRWPYRAQGLPRAEQAGRLRMLARPAASPERVLAAAAAIRRARRAMRGPARPGHHRLAAALRRRPVRARLHFAEEEGPQDLPRRSQARARRPATGRPARGRAAAWRTETDRGRRRAGTRAAQPGADRARRQVSPGQAHGGRLGQPRRGAAPRAGGAATRCRPISRRAAGAGSTRPTWLPCARHRRPPERATFPCVAPPRQTRCIAIWTRDKPPLYSNHKKKKEHNERVRGRS